MSLLIGAARIDRVEEQAIAIPIAAFTDDAAFIADRIAPLPTGFLDPATMTFQFCFQSWVIRVDGLTVLVDPCNGNGRKRGNVPVFDDLDTPYLERLAAIGTPAEAIDIVFCTHMHNDHCGWNTQPVDGRWVPTFPNATYVFVDAEYARWDTASPSGHPNDFNVSVFDESVRPVVEAGQAKIVSLPYGLSPSVTVEPAVGHTVGHAMLRLESDGATAYFVGDTVHHPAQVFRPDLHLPGCDDLMAAIATRRTVFQRVSAQGAILFPAHFAAPHHGRVEVGGDEFVFLPGGAPDDREAQRILDRNRNQGSATVLDSHPQLRAYIQSFLETFLVHGRVDPRLRELAILRIAWRCRQPYEWAQHHKRGRTVGVTDDDTLAVRSSVPDATLDDPERLIVRAADEVVDLGYLTPATYGACGELFDDPAVLLEFLHLVAGYRMMATILNTTRPSISEAGLPEWPPDGVGPD